MGETRVFLINTTVHDHQDAVGLRPLGRIEVADALLQPEIRDLETHYVFDDLGNKLGSAKYVHQVNFAFRGTSGIQRRISLLAQDPGDRRVNGDDAVPLCCMYLETEKLGRFGLSESPTTAIVLVLSRMVRMVSGSFKTSP